jgi:RimJ/RimL family protein N-acetyltransferase
MLIFAETERFILREFLPDDIEGLFDMDADPEVHRYLGNNPISTKEEAKEIIDFIRDQYITNGVGRWAIIDKTNNEFAGWTGFKLVREIINNHSNFYDLGYRLRKKYWGQGVATETGNASLQYGFEKMKMDIVYAMANCDNAGSNNVLKKLGFRVSGSFILDNIPHYWYILPKTLWEKRLNSANL